jgi:DNA polymerase-1
VFVVADYSMIQLRILADQTQDAAMMAAFRTRADLHRVTAGRTLGRTPEEVTDEERHAGKSENFGFSFGQGARSFVIYALEKFGVLFTLEEAQRHRAAFFETYRGVAEWHARVGQARPLEVRTASGRLRRFESRDSGYCEKLNTPIQGTEADGLKRAMTLLHERLPPLGARIVLCVHDEIVVEAPKDTAPEVEEVVRAAMVEGMAEVVKSVPIVVESAVRRTWGKGG